MSADTLAVGGVVQLAESVLEPSPLTAESFTQARLEALRAARAATPVEHWHIDAETMAAVVAGEPVEFDHDVHCRHGSLFERSHGWEPCPVCIERAKLEAVRTKLRRLGIPEHDLELSWRDVRLDLAPEFRECYEYAKAIDESIAKPQHLYMYGKHGRGKTRMTSLICLTAARAGYRVHVVRMSALIANIKHGYNYPDEGVTEHEAIANMTRADLLVIDDPGRGATRDLGLERRLLEAALEYRYNAGVPTIITANASPEIFVNGGDAYLPQGFGTLVASRLPGVKVLHFSHPHNLREMSSEQIAALPAYRGDSSA